MSGSKRGVTQAIERKLKRGNTVEPVIGHLKSDGRLDRNFLKGVEGSAMNALLCGTGHNLRKIIRKPRLLYAFCGITVREWLLRLLLLGADLLKPVSQFRGRACTAILGELNRGFSGTTKCLVESDEPL